MSYHEPLHIAQAEEKSQGNVVLVTGDGINDALCIKKCRCGDCNGSISHRGIKRGKWEVILYYWMIPFLPL